MATPALMCVIGVTSKSIVRQVPCSFSSGEQKSRTETSEDHTMVASVLSNGLFPFQFASIPTRSRSNSNSAARGPAAWTKDPGVYILRPPPPWFPHQVPSFPSLPSLSRSRAVPDPSSLSNLQFYSSFHRSLFHSQCSALPRSSCLLSPFPVHRLRPFTPSASLKSSPIPPRSGKPLVYVDLKVDDDPSLNPTGFGFL